jgi:dehydrogenase/reductase SDR family protein 1
MMVPRKSGLIVTISSPGGLRYLFNVAYGVGKAACDRMAQDCGIELRNSNVTMISLWPGPVKTEAIVESMERKSPLLVSYTVPVHSPGFSLVGWVILKIR